MYSHFIFVLEKYLLAHLAVDPGFCYSYLPLSSIVLPSPITQAFTISSPALINRVPPTSSMYCIEKIAKSTCDISCESPSVMISFTECSYCAPRSTTGRASWNSQRKNQDLSVGGNVPDNHSKPFHLNLSQKVSAMVCFHCLSQECHRRI